MDGGDATETPPGGPCPRCGGALSPGGADGAAFCAACRGVFWPRAALAEGIGVGADHPLLDEARVRATLTSAACPSCRAVPLERLRLDEPGTVRVDACPRCRGVFVDGADAAALRERVAALAARPTRTERARDEAARLAATTRLPDGGPWVDAVAVPVALAASSVLVATDLRALPELAVNMPLHEIGHAAIAWFTGHMAIPLPFVTLAFPERQSPAIIALLFAALVAAVVAGVRTKRRYLVVIGGVGLVAQGLLTGPLARHFSGTWMAGSGVAGEYVWSTLLLVSFHHRMPDRMRWDFWRWLALAAGAFGLVAVTHRWWGDVPDLAAGEGTRVGVHASTDMSVLVDEYGIGPARLRSVYRALGAACFGAVGVHWAALVLRRLASARRRAS
jgi:Zn-finger nucleic acid-binding protein